LGLVDRLFLDYLVFLDHLSDRLDPCFLLDPEYRLDQWNLVYLNPLDRLHLETLVIPVNLWDQLDHQPWDRLDQLDPALLEDQFDR
jgi:hypothetical protein